MIRFQRHPYQEIHNEASVWKATTVPSSKDRMLTHSRKQNEVKGSKSSQYYTSGSFTQYQIAFLQWHSGTTAY